MGTCSAMNCNNRSGGLPAKDGSKVRFFRFPADPIRKRKWLVNLRRRHYIPKRHSGLCHVHFEKNQFEQHRADGLVKLKPNAIPTIFDYSEKVKPPPQKKRVRTSSRQFKRDNQVSPGEADKSSVKQRTTKKKPEESQTKKMVSKRKLNKDKAARPVESAEAAFIEFVESMETESRNVKPDPQSNNALPVYDHQYASNNTDTEDNVGLVEIYMNDEGGFAQEPYEPTPCQNCETLKTENTTLKTENEKLKNDFENLKTANGNLNTECGKLKTENRKLTNQVIASDPDNLKKNNQTLKTENYKLKNEVSVLRKQFMFLELALKEFLSDEQQKALDVIAKTVEYEWEND